MILCHHLVVGRTAHRLAAAPFAAAGMRGLSEPLRGWYK
jgi:hypothetical protein